jgi:hypothetical protein
MAALAILLSPVTARADGLTTFFIGRTLNPSEGAGAQAKDRTTWGVALGGGGIVGFEVDFGRTKEFFGDNDELGDNSMTTLMFNLVVSAPVDRGGAGVRPYASGGVGLLKARVDSAGDLLDIDSNDFGVDLGFGVIGFVSRGLGFRGDIRYFRNLSSGDEETEGLLPELDLGDFSFWRGTIGLTLRF